MKKVYSVYDSQLETWATPIIMKNKGEAVRSFTKAVNDDEILKPIAQHVTLFEVGEFNEETCRISGYDAYVAIGNGIEFVNKPDPNQGNLFAIPPNTTQN